MQPYDLVKTKYKLPFELYPFQEEVVNQLATNDGAGYFAEVGTGKTSMSSTSALYQHMQYKTKHVIVIVPPILILTWEKWLAKVEGVDFMAYQGSPAQRKDLKFDKLFIIVSLGIFKRDYERFENELGDVSCTVIVDEATSIKNVGSDNHKKLAQFVSRPDCYLMLLTGTPLSTPIDAYAYIKLITPGLYRSLYHFEQLHVSERDFFKKPTKWGNLELLQENLALNSTRIRKEDVLKDLPEVTYDPIFYDLAKDHLRLYKKLAEERMIVFKEEGKKIDMTNVSALFHALQQIILGYAHFSGDPNNRPAGYDLVDEILTELGGKKLMIFSNYQRTNRELLAYLQPYGAVGAYGELGSKVSAANFQKFVNDPSCQVFVANCQSAGQGLDMAQYVCKDMLFLECPMIPKDFRQAVGRLHRSGARDNIHVRIAVAQGTVQSKLLKNMLAKDEVTSFIQRDYSTLHNDIFGTEN